CGERQPVTQPVSHLCGNATLCVTGKTAWHGFRLRVQTSSRRCLHKMYWGDEANSGEEGPHFRYCCGSGDLEDSRSGIRFSIGCRTLSFSQEDRGPFSYISSDFCDRSVVPSHSCHQNPKE